MDEADLQKWIRRPEDETATAELRRNVHPIRPESMQRHRGIPGHRSGRNHIQLGMITLPTEGPHTIAPTFPCR